MAKKTELTWYDNLIIRMLRRHGMPAASVIVQTAWPGYSIKKIRKDAGVKKGGRQDENTKEG